MNKFVNVFNKIIRITSAEITFECEKGRVTFLRRRGQGMVIWKITNDGLLVRREFAEGYKLSFNPVDI